MTAVRFSLPVRGYLSLRVFDLLGREIATLAEGEFEAGEHLVRWNASGYASGIYFCRLQGDRKAETRRMVLMK